jgi:hypothetical protein
MPADPAREAGPEDGITNGAPSLNFECLNPVCGGIVFDAQVCAKTTIAC